MRTKLQSLKVSAWMALVFILGWGAVCSRTDASDASPMKPVVVAAVSSLDSVWNDLERLGGEMGYKDNITGFRMVFGETQGLDTTRPFGFVVLANEQEYLPYGFFPVENLDELQIGMFESSDWNLVEKDGKKIYTPAEGESLELVERDGWLLVTQLGKADLIPEGNPADLVADVTKDRTIGVKVDVKGCPKTLFDPLYAWFRQLSAAPQGPASVQFKLMESYLAMFSDAADSFSLGVSVSENGDLVFESSLVPMVGSTLADAMNQTAAMKSRWLSFFQPSESVVAGITSRCMTEEQLEYSRESNRVSFDDLYSNLEIYLEEEEDNLELIKDMVQDFRNAVDGMYMQQKTDGAFSMTKDAVFMLASSTTDSTSVKSFLTKLEKWVKSVSPELADRFILQGPEINGYAVSTFTIPFDKLAEVSDTAAEVTIFEGRELAFAVGVKKDAVLVFVGLDENIMMDQFKKASASGDEQAIPETRGMFSISNLGYWLSHFISDKDDSFAPLVDLLKQIPENATIETAVSYQDGAEKGRSVINAATFAALGDIIRSLSAQEEADSDSDENIQFDDEESDEDSEPESGKSL